MWLACGNLVSVSIADATTLSLIPTWHVFEPHFDRAQPDFDVHEALSLGERKLIINIHLGDSNVARNDWTRMLRLSDAKWSDPPIEVAGFVWNGAEGIEYSVYVPEDRFGHISDWLKVFAGAPAAKSFTALLPNLFCWLGQPLAMKPGQKTGFLSGDYPIAVGGDLGLKFMFGEEVAERPSNTQIMSRIERQFART